MSMHKSRGSVLWLWGCCICAGGALLWVLPWLLWWFVLFVWACCNSVVSSHCPCLRGPSLSSFKWSCSLPLFEFSFSRFFPFLFSLIIKCVCCQCTHQAGDSRKTKIPLKLKLRYTPTKGTLGICLCSTIGRMPGDRTSLSLDARLVIPMRVLRFKASRRARILSPPAEPPVLVLWLNQVTRSVLWWTAANPPWDFGYEPLPCTGSDRRFRLAFLATMRPALDPAANGSLESGLLVSPLLRGLARHRPFAPALDLHQHKSSRNLHLQYSAKSQSTPRCQSLIKTKSDHPLVLGRYGPQSPPWWVHWQHT
jgi:hypothetical protein